MTKIAGSIRERRDPLHSLLAIARKWREVGRVGRAG
jgi:hypothetical protein